jgi:hypothetical protein
MVIGQGKYHEANVKQHQTVKIEEIP